MAHLPLVTTRLAASNDSSFTSRLRIITIYPVTNENFSNQYQFILTDEGRYSPILSLDDDDYQSLQHWQQLPKLVGYSRVKRAKANTTVLAIHPSDISEFGPRVLLAYHLTITDELWFTSSGFLAFANDDRQRRYSLS